MPSRETVFLRHAIYNAQLAHRANKRYLAGGDALQDGLARFDLERPNIEAAQAWVVDQRALAEHLKLCVHFAIEIRHILSLRLSPAQRIAWLNAALQAARDLNEPRSEALALGELGSAHYALGQVITAREIFEQQLALARATHNGPNEVSALGSLGSVAYALGDIRPARSV